MKRSHRQSLHLSPVEATIVGRAATRKALATPDYARMVTVEAARGVLGEEEVQRIERDAGGSS